MTTRTGNSSHPALSHADGLAANTSDLLLLVGRILLAWVFLRSGYGKLFDIGAVANSFPPRGLPAFLAYISVPFVLRHALRRSWFRYLYVGRDFQLARVLGFGGRGRTPRPGRQFLEEHCHVRWFVLFVC